MERKQRNGLKSRDSSLALIARAGSETLRWIMLQVAQVAVQHSPAALAY